MPNSLPSEAHAAFKRSVQERPFLTGREITFGTEEIIVSKTDTKGIITYANKVFIRLSGYTARELVGAPHSILRHPSMPMCVFGFLWERITSGNECFAYVLNRSKGGDEYWVFAHVTPTLDESGGIVAYHSNRRVPDPGAVARIKPIYAALLAEEARHGGKRQALAAGRALFEKTVKDTGMDYDQLVFAL